MKEELFENNEIILELQDGIVVAKLKLEHFDLQTAQKLVENRKNVTNGISYPLLANIMSVKSSTKKARDFMASEQGCEGIIAAAVLINSPIGSMIGNFWIRVSKPLRPTKIFTNESEAKKWLAQYIIKD